MSKSSTNRYSEGHGYRKTGKPRKVAAPRLTSEEAPYMVGDPREIEEALQRGRRHGSVIVPGATQEPARPAGKKYRETEFSKKIEEKNKIITEILAIYEKRDGPFQHSERKRIYGSHHESTRSQLKKYLKSLKKGEINREEWAKAVALIPVEDAPAEWYAKPELSLTDETESGSSMDVTESTNRRLLGGSEASVVQLLPAVETETTSYSCSVLTVGIVSAGLLLTGFILRRIVRRWSAKPRPVAETNEISIVVRDSAAADLA